MLGIRDLDTSSGKNYPGSGARAKEKTPDPGSGSTALMLTKQGITVCSQERKDDIHEGHLVEDGEGEGARLHQVPQQVHTLHKHSCGPATAGLRGFRAAADAVFLG